ncbi:hypothetical protein CLOP_g12461 [Closterium sp. NIES-67]|nr:hypothetical protein CLOP_g12461 [Closterium sp. NIES-67]
MQRPISGRLKHAGSAPIVVVADDVPPIRIAERRAIDHLSDLDHPRGSPLASAKHAASPQAAAFRAPGGVASPGAFAPASREFALAAGSHFHGSSPHAHGGHGHGGTAGSGGIGGTSGGGASGGGTSGGGGVLSSVAMVAVLLLLLNLSTIYLFFQSGLSSRSLTASTADIRLRSQTQERVMEAEAALSNHPPARAR